MNIVDYDQKITTDGKNAVYLTFGKDKVYISIQGRTGGVGTAMTKKLYRKFLKEALSDMSFAVAIKKRRESK